MPDLSDDPVAQLRTRWADLSDLDRALEIGVIHRSGLSIRKIANGLQPSESLLRHLLADVPQGTGIEAAISLLILGHRDVEKIILARLEAGNILERLATARLLIRVRNGRTLAFAREAIKKIAEDPALHAFLIWDVEQLLARIPAGP